MYIAGEKGKLRIVFALLYLLRSDNMKSFSALMSYFFDIQNWMKADECNISN